MNRTRVRAGVLQGSRRQGKGAHEFAGQRALRLAITRTTAGNSGSPYGFPVPRPARSVCRPHAWV